MDDILTLVDIALGNASISSCEAGDANNDGQITVDEILIAVHYALHDCPLVIVGKLPTPGPDTPTPSTCATVGQFCDNSTVFCCSGTSACDAFTGVCDF
jgi:hypothetical protein